ncbi:MAG: peptide-methionine (S)-S-oxide reductase MsrA, partial [Deltaproteobacteria bacterium]|nr:peptide-methionine (S)-S-oxide reductase MsrA [Deltaproteobacteria bacterium]
MKTLFLLIVLLIFSSAGFMMANSAETMKDGKMNTQDGKIEIATFAGGCFWCTESDFEKLTGVVQAISGYTGGTKENASYKEVSAGTTGHVEAVQIYFDPSMVTYKELVDYFWKHINPTDPGGQFVDRGRQYRSAIFYHDENQRRIAEKSKETLNRSGKFKKPVVTDILNLSAFYSAEKYHQDYYKRNPLRYKYYRYGSGRDQFLKKVWVDDMVKPKSMSQKKYTMPDDETVKKRPTPMP